MHVKGLEMPGYEPRSLQTMALALAVSTRGACHNRSSAYEADFSNVVNRIEGDAKRGGITAEGEDFSAVLDSLIWCKFLRKAFDDFWGESADSLNLITGWDVKPDELKRAGERINNLKKLFNIREGWTRADDTLPRRVLTEPLPDGAAAGVDLSDDDLQMMVMSYYHVRGWNPDGTIPSISSMIWGCSSWPPRKRPQRQQAIAGHLVRHPTEQSAKISMLDSGSRLGCLYCLQTETRYDVS